MMAFNTNPPVANALKIQILEYLQNHNGLASDFNAT